MWLPPLCLLLAAHPVDGTAPLLWMPAGMHGKPCKPQPPAWLPAWLLVCEPTLAGLIPASFLPAIQRDLLAPKERKMKSLKRAARPVAKPLGVLAMMEAEAWYAELQARKEAKPLPLQPAWVAVAAKWSR